MQNLENDTSQRPNINDPGMHILFDLHQKFFIIVEAILIQDVVQYLRRHVFGSRHRELFQVRHNKTRTKINNLHVFYKVRKRFAVIQPKQNVFSLEIGVHDIVGVEEHQGLTQFDY